MKSFASPFNTDYGYFGQPAPEHPRSVNRYAYRMNEPEEIVEPLNVELQQNVQQQEAPEPIVVRRDGYYTRKCKYSKTKL